MSRPKKDWVLSGTEVTQTLRAADKNIPLNDRRDLLPEQWVRVVVDGKGYYAQAFSEEDWLAAKTLSEGRP